MAQRRLHLGQRGAAVDGMRAVRVAQPVRRYSLVDAGLPGRALDHAVDGALGQVAAFAAGEDGIVGAGLDAQASRAVATGDDTAWRTVQDRSDTARRYGPSRRLARARRGRKAGWRTAGPAKRTVMAWRRARTKTPRKSDRGKPQKSMVLISTCEFQMGKAKRAALYVRVSTDHQSVENQVRELKEVAERRGWTVVEVYRDAGISGAKGRDQRPGLDAMLKDANRRKFDVVMAWGRAFSTQSGLQWPDAHRVFRSRACC